MLIQNNEVLSFNTGLLQLDFMLDNGVISLAAIKGQGASLVKDVHSPDIWRIALVGPDGSTVEFASSESPGKIAGSAVKKAQAGCRFRWNIKIPDGAIAEVKVGVRCRENDPLSYWTFSTKLPQGWKVSRVDFPLIPNIRNGSGLKLAAPVGWGLEYQKPGNEDYAASFPSCAAAMQFISLYRKDEGIYIGTHDPTASHKLLKVCKGEQKDLISACITNWTAQDGATDFKLPYEAVIGITGGGYMEAASIYRNWVEKSAPWKTANVSRRDISEWMKNSGLWFRVYGDAPETVDALRKAREFFDIDTSLHWYRWHQIPYDTLYPEYLPPKEGWPGAIKEAQKLGFRVMPYINGRLWDPASESWKNENAEESAATREEGGCYTEVYGSKVPLNVMCPSTPLWQNKVVGLVKALIGDYGVDGVYIDQIGAAYPERCFNPNHDHQPGGGDFWTRSYRTLLEKVRKELPPDKIITTEENAEPWNDLFDGLLIVNTHTKTEAPPIPLYPAVYSGKVIPFAFQYSREDDLEKSWPFRMKMARCFLWGSQLGWYDVELVMKNKYVKEAEFLRNLARVRAKSHKFLLHGRFLGEVKVAGDNPIIDCEAAGSFGGTYMIHLPTVMATKWQSPDGKTAIAICNTGNEPRTVKVEGKMLELAPISAAVVDA